MSLHCAATRPKFLNVFFSNPLTYWLETLENPTWQFLMFFVFFRLLTSTLVSTSCSLCDEVMRELCARAIHSLSAREYVRERKRDRQGESRRERVSKRVREWDRKEKKKEESEWKRGKTQRERERRTWSKTDRESDLVTNERQENRGTRERERARAREKS